MIGLISYLVFFATVSSILAIAVLGLNLQWGNTGLFNGGVAAFFGAGAYGLILLGGTEQADHIGGFELFYPVALVGGILLSGLIALVVGMLTIRLRRDYLAIATFGVAVAFENLMRNAEWLSGGAQGMRGFERPFEDSIADPFVFNIIFFLLFRIITSGCLSIFREVDPLPLWKVVKSNSRR